MDNQISSEEVRAKIASAFDIPIAFLESIPNHFDGMSGFTGSFQGEDGFISYDITRYSFLKREHVLSWLSKAYTNAKLSHAEDLKVGALVVDITSVRPQILSDGYNGTEPGTDNCCEDSEGESLGQDVVLHAERNALDKLDKLKISTSNCAIVATRSPCDLCCERILKAGIKEVYFTEQHRLVVPLLKLQSKGVRVVHIPKEEVIEYMKATVTLLEKDRFC